MTSHFIEGTEEQYSIREDGVIVGHYYERHGKRFLRENVLSKKLYTNQNYDVYKTSIRVKGKNRLLRINTLMFKYFNQQECRDCGCNIHHKDRKYLCKECKRLHVNINVEVWNKKNPIRCKEISDLEGRKGREILDDNYIRRLLKMTKKEAPKELIELKRITIKTQRLCQQ